MENKNSIYKLIDDYKNINELREEIEFLESMQEQINKIFWILENSKNDFFSNILKKEFLIEIEEESYSISVANSIKKLYNLLSQNIESYLQSCKKNFDWLLTRDFLLYLWETENKNKTYDNFIINFSKIEKISFEKKLNLLSNDKTYEKMYNFLNDYIENLIEDNYDEIGNINIENNLGWEIENIKKEVEEKFLLKNTIWNFKTLLDGVIWDIYNPDNKNKIIYSILNNYQIKEIENLIIFLEKTNNIKLLEKNSDLKNIHDFLIKIQENLYNITLNAEEFIENLKFKKSEISFLSTKFSDAFKIKYFE